MAQADVAMDVGHAGASVVLAVACVRVCGGVSKWVGEERRRRSIVMMRWRCAGGGGRVCAGSRQHSMSGFGLCVCACERGPWFHEGCVRTWTKKEGGEEGRRVEASSIRHRPLYCAPSSFCPPLASPSPMRQFCSVLRHSFPSQNMPKPLNKNVPAFP